MSAARGRDLETGAPSVTRAPNRRAASRLAAVAVQAVVGLVSLVAGCNVVAPASYILFGPGQIEAEHELAFIDGSRSWRAVQAFKRTAVYRALAHLRFGEGCDRTRGEVSKDRCYGREARERIAAAPLDWLSLAPMKVQALLDYEAAPAVYLRVARVLTPARSEWFIKWLTAWHRVTLALALLALATVRAWPGALRLSVAAVAGTVAVHCVFFGGDRYHFVFTPLLCVVAGAVLPPKPGARP